MTSSVVKGWHPMLQTEAENPDMNYCISLGTTTDFSGTSE